MPTKNPILLNYFQHGGSSILRDLFNKIRFKINPHQASGDYAAENQIKRAIGLLRKQYNLDNYKADNALITASFGQNYFDEGIKRLLESKAVSELAGKGELLILVITSVDTTVKDCPEWIKIIQLNKIPNWPSANSYQNRFIKWSIPLLFRNVKNSVYIDNGLIITNYPVKMKNLFDAIKDLKFIVTAHPLRKNWVDEYNAIMKSKRFLDRKKIMAQKDFFESLKLPYDIPITENAFLGRAHNSKFNAINLKVLSQLLQYSERDQLGIIYAMNITKLRPAILPSGEIFYTHLNSYINRNTVCFSHPTQKAFNRVEKQGPI